LQHGPHPQGLWKTLETHKNKYDRICESSKWRLHCNTDHTPSEMSLVMSKRKLLVPSRPRSQGLFRSMNGGQLTVATERGAQSVVMAKTS